MPMNEAYQREAQLIKALAHPARLRILDILSRREACVCHLTTLLKQRQPYISQQLIVLREAGLVKDRRDGTTVYYTLADPRVAEMLDLARELLAAQGERVRFPEVPEGALEGCPCPMCQQAGAACACS